MQWHRAWYSWHEENEASTTRSAKGRIEAWIERLKLQGALFGAVEPRFSMSSGDETTYSADLLFNDTEAVQKALEDPQAVQEGLRVQQADYRSAQEMQAKFYYQAALLLPESPSRQTLMNAEHVLPGIRRIVPLCDCREDKNGGEPPASERKIFAMGEIKSLSLLTEVKPLYPAAALASKIGGKVVLELIVNEKGDVENARVLNSANPVLDDSALAAVKQYKFSAPTTDKGQVVNAYWIVSVNYEP
jgi:TonB family protein